MSNISFGCIIRASSSIDLSKKITAAAVAAVISISHEERD